MIKREWLSEENRKIFEKAYNFCYDADLALESYADNNNKDGIYENEAFSSFIKLTKTKHDLTEEELVKEFVSVADKFRKIIEEIGVEKFRMYDDGGVSYIWKSENKERKKDNNVFTYKVNAIIENKKKDNK